MKIVHICISLLLFFASCKPNDKKISTTPGTIAADSSNQKTGPTLFFPVTNYIKGQIYEIKHGYVTPLKIVLVHNHRDTSWIKMENLDTELTDFLSPEIDSANLISVFSETKFLDQTLDAITFTYDPIKLLPDSFLLKHWDVYIDPNSGQVKQVYLLKKLEGNRTQQLTWLSGKSCNIKIITDDANGNSSVEKEISIKWDL